AARSQGRHRRRRLRRPQGCRHRVDHRGRERKNWRRHGSQRPAGHRLKLLDKNAEIYRDIVLRIVRAEPNAALLVVSDPPDPLADIARDAGPGAAVFSTRTDLDSQPLPGHLAKYFWAAPAHVEAHYLVDHATPQSVH